MRKYFSIFVIILLSGCATIHVFKEAKINEEHAVIVFQKPRESGMQRYDQEVQPVEINGKKPSFWKWGHTKFRIQPGPTIIHAQAYLPSRNVTAFASIRFEAKNGETYYISREVNIEDVVFMVKDSEEAVVYRTSSKKVPARPDPTYIPYYYVPQQ